MEGNGTSQADDCCNDFPEESDGLRPVDLVTLSGILKVCDLEVVLLDAQGPRAHIASRVHDGALACTVQTGFSCRGRFMLPIDWCMLAFVHATSGKGSWCHGTPLKSGDVLTVMPKGISEFAFSEHTRMTIMLIPLERFARLHSEVILGKLAVGGGNASVFQAGGNPESRQLEQSYEQLREQLLATGTTARSESGAFDVDALTRQHLEALSVMAGSDRPSSTRGRAMHYQILQRAEGFMIANLRRNIYMHEICNAAGVSERALRYAFDDLLGISPNRYLSMVRLCTACRSLSMNAAGRRSVKSIALSCGLWDLSRFADNYRRVFGELPRDTLLRTPPGSLDGGLSAPGAH